MDRSDKKIRLGTIHIHPRGNETNPQAEGFRTLEKTSPNNSAAQLGDGEHEGLQYVDCAVEESHCVDLLLLFWGKENTIR